MSNPGPRPVPAQLLDPLRRRLYSDSTREALDQGDPTRYRTAATAVEDAYEQGYAAGWLRGYQKGDEADRRHRLLKTAENGGHDGSALVPGEPEEGAAWLSR